MATGAEFVNLTAKRLLGREDFADRFLDYLKGNHGDLSRSVYRTDGVFDSALGLSADGSDRFKIDGTEEAIDGDGHIIDAAASGYASGIQFENTNAVQYDVALHYAEKPAGVQVNPRTGLPEFVKMVEAVGEKADPDLVSLAGGGLNLRINSVAEAGVSNAGRACMVWKKLPGAEATIEADAIEIVTVQYSGGNNYVLTSGQFGQGAASIVAADYSVLLLGPTVRRNTSLDGTGEHVFVGKVTGAGAGNPPSIFDVTLQRTITATLTDLSQVLRTDVHGFAKVRVKADASDVDEKQIEVQDSSGIPKFYVDEDGDVTVEGNLWVKGTTTQENVVQVNSSETITDNLTAGDAGSDTHQIKGSWYHTDATGAVMYFHVNGLGGGVGIGTIGDIFYGLKVTNGINVVSGDIQVDWGDLFLSDGGGGKGTLTAFGTGLSRFAGALQVDGLFSVANTGIANFAGAINVNGTARSTFDGDLRLESTTPRLEWRDTNVGYTGGGLWRIENEGGNFVIDQNTHSSGAFGTYQRWVFMERLTDNMHVNANVVPDGTRSIGISGDPWSMGWFTGINVAASTDTTAGTIRYNGGIFEGRNASAWIALDTQGQDPGGADTQVQFNSSGNFAGDAGFVWDNVNKILKPTTVQLGTTTDTTAGNIRWNGSNFQGYTGAVWIDLDAQGSPAGAEGYIQYYSGGAFGAESALFWDAANNRLGINESTPLRDLHVTGRVAIQGSNSIWDLVGNAGSLHVGTYLSSQVDNPVAGEIIIGMTPTGNAIDSVIGQLSFYSSDGSGTATGRQCAVKALNEVSLGEASGLSFHTGTGTEGALAAVERMRIRNDGRFVFGSATTKIPTANVHYEFRDDAQIANTGVRISADDESPWALVVGNNTYSASASTGWSMYVSDLGIAHQTALSHQINGLVGIGGAPGSLTALRVYGGIQALGGVPSGATTNVGYAFAGGSGDNDSGMFSDADGTLKFYTNNALRSTLTTLRTDAIRTVCNDTYGFQVRSGAAAKGAIFYADTSNHYILLTDAASTNFNALRPFRINLTSGDVLVGDAKTTFHHSGVSAMGTGVGNARNTYWGSGWLDASSSGGGAGVIAGNAYTRTGDSLFAYSNSHASGLACGIATNASAWNTVGIFVQGAVASTAGSTFIPSYKVVFEQEKSVWLNDYAIMHGSGWTYDDNDWFIQGQQYDSTNSGFLHCYELTPTSSATLPYSEAALACYNLAPYVAIPVATGNCGVFGAKFNSGAAGHGGYFWNNDSTSATNRAIYARADGIANAKYAVAAYAHNGGANYALYGYASGGSTNWGILNGAGSKSWANPHPEDPTKCIVYATVEAEKDTAFLKGRAQLVNGTVTIVFPDHFKFTASELAEEDVNVIVTPRDAASKGLAVTQSDHEGFTVVELASGTGSYEFDYHVTARRRGYEDGEPMQPNDHYIPGQGMLSDSEEDAQMWYDRHSDGLKRIFKSAGLLDANGLVNEATFAAHGWNVKKPKGERRKSQRDARAAKRQN